MKRSAGCVAAPMGGALSHAHPEFATGRKILTFVSC
jgi:hypothetical protein